MLDSVRPFAAAVLSAPLAFGAAPAIADDHKGLVSALQGMPAFDKTQILLHLPEEQFCKIRPELGRDAYSGSLFSKNVVCDVQNEIPKIKEAGIFPDWQMVQIEQLVPEIQLKFVVDLYDEIARRQNLIVASAERDFKHNNPKPVIAFPGQESQVPVFDNNSAYIAAYDKAVSEFVDDGGAHKFAMQFLGHLGEDA